MGYKFQPPPGPLDTRVPNAIQTRFLQQVLGITDEVGYGSKTKEAVSVFQKRNGIEVDEQVMIGPRTWQAVMDLYEQQEQAARGPVAAVTNENAAAKVEAPIQNLPGQRSAAAYDRVIDQFGVEENPRFRVRDLNRDGYDDTFCNIFLWDVTSAMGAEIPHWVGGRELNANAVVMWLEQDGAANGWRKVSDQEAQEAANQGCPAVVVWHSGSGGPGHVAMVRPGAYSPTEGPAIAQAGLTNFSHGTVARGFGQSRLRIVSYYVHD